MGKYHWMKLSDGSLYGLSKTSGESITISAVARGALPRLTKPCGRGTITTTLANGGGVLIRPGHTKPERPKGELVAPAWWNRKLDDKTLGYRMPKAATWKQEISGFKPWVGERGPPCLFDWCHSS